MKYSYLSAALAMTMMLGSGNATAEEAAPHSMHHGMTMPHDGMKAGTFLEKATIDGYEVSFHVMKAGEDMAHGGAYNYMVKVEKDGKPVALQAVNSKVTQPDQSSASKMMMQMGDWYMAGYDFPAAGEYQLMVLFKTQDGSKHFGGVKYTSDGK